MRKKVVVLILVLIMCLSFVACGEELSLEERVPEVVKEHISENFRIRDGNYVSEAINVDIASVVEEKNDKQWTVAGTYTVKIVNEIVSAEFVAIVTYDMSTDEFKCSNVEFDDFE